MSAGTLTKRAQKAIGYLELHGGSIHSFQLNGPLRTNFSPRAIYEARKAGYIISSTNEKLGNAWGVRYTLVSSPGKMEPKPTLRPKLVFDKIRQMYVEATETLTPQQPVQESFL